MDLLGQWSGIGHTLKRDVSAESRLFLVPWRESGGWVWESDPSTQGGRSVSLAGKGPRGLREIRQALWRRREIQSASVVFAWELRSIMAARLVLGNLRNPAPLVAVAPVVKGPWRRFADVTGRILSGAARVVWMSEQERRTFPSFLGLDQRKMLTDRVPGAVPLVPLSEGPPPIAPIPVVAAGISARDLPTLADALSRLDCPATVVAPGRRPSSMPATVRWTGPLPEETVLEMLREPAIHVLCLRPVDYSCGQSTLVRACMAGLPTVATELAVLDEYGDPAAVTRVPVGNPESVAEAVRCWQADPDAWTTARAAAFEFGRQFEHAPFARRMAAIGDHVLAERSEPMG